MSFYGYDSVTAAIDGLQQRGYTANFMFFNDCLRALESDKRYHPEELAIIEHYRFEGASDPEDMAIVYALEGSDGTRGVLVDAFGAYANPLLGEFLHRIQRHESAF